MDENSPQQPLRVLIAGGGVAALEAALALRANAGDRVTTTLLATGDEFVYRPMSVGEPFARVAARRYPLRKLTDGVHAELRTDTLTWVDPQERVAHTAGGQAIRYDALLLALGARAQPAFHHAVTLDVDRLDDQLHGLVQDLEGGYLASLGLIVPSGHVWPLPLYEVALMCAARAAEMSVATAIALITPERAPLECFGEAASDAVAQQLAGQRVALITGTTCQISEPGRVRLTPRDRELSFTQVVALPELYGPAIGGIPAHAPGGFVDVDRYGRVRGLDGVLAAGDMIASPIKHGSLAARQAEVAATTIAAMAGAPVTPHSLEPVLEGVLYGGPELLHLSAHMVGGRATSSVVRTRPDGIPSRKIAARRLAPYLEQFDMLHAPATR